MSTFVYDRGSVPVGEVIKLEIQLKDSAGNNKDADAIPTIAITDGDGASVVAATSSSVIRVSEGYYRYEYTVGSGYQVGTWNDTWSATLDGYAINAIFDFHVNSQGEIEATGTTVVPQVEIGDACVENFNQDEIRCINKLLKEINVKLRNIVITPDGTRCDIFSAEDLVDFLEASLSEFNSTPTITDFGFDCPEICGVFRDIITTGGQLKAWLSLIPKEAAKEWTITDNGTQFTPASVSNALLSAYNAQYMEYRARLKEIKRNLRPSIRGLGSGNIAIAAPQYRRLRHLSERRIY